METSNTTYLCRCASGWGDTQCQTKIHYCEGITCLNNGVCRPMLLNYTCDCLEGSFLVRHCEMRSSQLAVYQTISKSFAYVVIIAMIIVALFIVVLDILKYCFGIDPIDRKPQSKKHKKRVKPITIVRFTYVNTPS